MVLGRHFALGRFNIHVLPPKGYENRAISPTVPSVDVKTILPQDVEQAWMSGSSITPRAFDPFLRERA